LQQFQMTNIWKDTNAYLVNQSRQAWIVEDQFYSKPNNRDHNLWKKETIMMKDTRSEYGDRKQTREKVK